MKAVWLLSLLFSACVSMPKPPSAPVAVAPTLVPVICAVMDGSTHSPVVGALCDIDGQFANTNTEGIAVFLDITVGTHTLKVSRDGYLSVSASLTVLSAGNVPMVLTRLALPLPTKRCAEWTV